MLIREMHNSTTLAELCYNFAATRLIYCLKIDGYAFLQKGYD